MNSPSNSYQQLPDSESLDLARASAAELSRLLAEHPESDRARVQMDGHDLILPRQALELLKGLLIEMAQGHAVTIMPTHAELTTQEAANILNVSRPYLVKLLEEGKIPCTKVGSHRRILFRDLMQYKQSSKEQSKAIMDELTQQAQNLGMGY
jgi:excisionase family DNA binding protein